MPIRPDKSLESVLDILDYDLHTALFEDRSSRLECAPNEPDSSPRPFAMFGAAALSTGALLLAIPVPNLSLWRRVEKGNTQTCLISRRRRAGRPTADGGPCSAGRSSTTTGAASHRRGPRIGDSPESAPGHARAVRESHRCRSRPHRPPVVRWPAQ